ncbi:C1 family peptidase [bacterium]|nr:C1 family peptidase [bacterium]
MTAADNQAAVVERLASSTGGSLSHERLSELHTEFMAHPTASLMRNAVTQVSVMDIAQNRDIITSTPHTFSHKLDDWKVTNQRASGRCWLFAGLNLLRVGAMQAMNIKEFEFSQTYLHFWDKFERANYFLEAIIATAERDIDDRTVAFLLDKPLEDGGQWNMFVNLVKKHGLVPQSAMPESESSSNTRYMNAIVISKLRDFAQQLRDAVASGKSEDEVRKLKDGFVSVVYRMLCIHLGTPPQGFDWEWRDKDNKFHRDGRLTPQQFADKYVSINLDDYVSIVHDPRESSPQGRTYTVDMLGNVVGGDIVTYLNVDIELMKQLTMKQITDGQPVWMGCDVGKMMDRRRGVWDRELFGFERIYDTPFAQDKPGRLLHHQTLMTHAMLFTGVDVVDKDPRRWRVENSWGSEGGEQGFYVMNDNWFDEYMFEIAVPKALLSAELQQALEGEPTVLPAWDPMGALAGECMG